MSGLEDKNGEAELKNDSADLKSCHVRVSNDTMDDQNFVDDAELNNFLERLRMDFAKLNFKLGKKFTFRPLRTIIIQQASDYYEDNRDAEGFDEVWRRCYRLQVLHEIEHALSNHKDYATDLERLKMEREAWEKARELASSYSIYYDEEFVERLLDTYRDWLHKKSRCPQCGSTRYQTDDGEYRCASCEELGEW